GFPCPTGRSAALTVPSRSSHSACGTGTAPSRQSPSESIRRQTSRRCPSSSPPPFPRPRDSTILPNFLSATCVILLLSLPPRRPLCDNTPNYRDVSRGGGVPAHRGEV